MRKILVIGAAFILALAACKDGGGGGGGNTAAPNSPVLSGLTMIGPFQATLPRNLAVAEVQTIIAQAVNEARARGLTATIAISDRVGNIIAVFRIGGPRTIRIDSGRGNPTGLQALPDNIVPSTLAAISKALTGAYLSSAGNAFSTRTASFIIQPSFPPGQAGTGFESGPLFGVQFSQLPCSDLSTRFPATQGPHRAPLGFSAGPGGLPLYKDGVVVGGIGVSADLDGDGIDIYGADLEPILDVDTDPEEIIAVAGTVGFGPPAEIRAERIPVDGTTLKFTDRGTEALLSDPATAPSFAAINGPVGTLIPVTGYYAGGAVLAGVVFGTNASGIRLSTPADGFANPNIFVLTDGAGSNRFPPRAGTDTPGGLAANRLTAAEVRQFLESGFQIAQDGRAQIRRPLNSRIQVTVSIVDTNGQILGIVRTPDAPLFGTDVSLQKARTAAFFSGTTAAVDLNAAGAALIAAAPGFPAPFVATVTEAGTYISGRVVAVRTFFADPTALTGAVAFADRSGGNISRPFYPDGEVGQPAGPLSREIDDWNVFSTGLQESFIRANIIEHVAFVLGLGPDTPPACTTLPMAGLPLLPRLANGLQIFPGSVPLYRGDVLIGGIGVSGDGIDQDDMISFLGADRGGTALGGGIGNAAPAIRADQLSPQGVRLRYVNCPFRPFVESNEQNVCQGR